MGLLKNQAIRAGKATNEQPTEIPNDGGNKGCLWLNINGRLEEFRIGYPPSKPPAVAAQRNPNIRLVGMENIPDKKELGYCTVEGQRYKLSLNYGDFYAMPIKGKAKGQPTESTAIASNQPARKVERLYPKALRNTFRKYFNHPFNAILKPQGGQWFTRKKPLNPEQIWDYWRDLSTVIGLGFGEWTRYAIIDIDAGGRYHDEGSLNDIREALEEIGITKTILKQSSNSGGWHLWIPFERPLKSFAIACLLTEQLANWGFDIENGHLEINPNRKGRSKNAVTNYDRVRLPLQAGTGAAILDDDFAPYSTDIAEFLRLMEQAAIANDTDLIEELGESAWDRFRQLKKDKSGNPKNYRGAFATGGSAREWFREQDEAIRIGHTGYGQSNKPLLRHIAAKGRVQLGLGGQELADYIYTTMVNNPGYEKWCRHKKEMSAWATRWARSAEKHLYPYTGKVKPSDPLNPPGPDNEARKQDAIARIEKAVAELKESNQLPEAKTARLKAIAMLAHCSVATLYKYQHLWWVEAVTDTEAGITRDTDNYEIYPSIPLGSVEMLFFPPPPPEKITSSSPVLLPRRAKNTKTVQNLTGQGIQKISRFEAGETVPISRRLTIVNNRQNHTQQGTQPPLRIVNRPKLPIADPNPNGVKPGDWVVELHRPRALLRLESIDPDGEYCRCQDVHWGGRELCLLSELNHAPPDLVAEYLPNGDRHQTFTQPLTNHG